MLQIILSVLARQKPISDPDFTKTLGDKASLLYGTRLMTTLSTRAVNPPGDWDIRFQYDREAVTAENR